VAQRLVGIPFVSTTILAFVALPVTAQPTFAPPPQIPYGLSVSTESAKQAAAASVAEAQKNRWTVAVAIVDTGGHLLRLTGAIPIDGGVPIIVDGKVIGAVGVSGGSGAQDGQVATAGAAAVK
jgi:glc operon protein GlcG